MVIATVKHHSVSSSTSLQNPPINESTAGMPQNQIFRLNSVCGGYSTPPFSNRNFTFFCVPHSWDPEEWSSGHFKLVIWISLSVENPPTSHHLTSSSVVLASAEFLFPSLCNGGAGQGEAGAVSQVWECASGAPEFLCLSVRRLWGRASWFASLPSLCLPVICLFSCMIDWKEDHCAKLLLFSFTLCLENQMLGSKMLSLEDVHCELRSEPFNFESYNAKPRSLATAIVVNVAIWVYSWLTESVNLVSY